MKKILIALAISALLPSGAILYAEDAQVLYSFEESVDGWGIPDWAMEKEDHVQRSIEVSDKYASNGTKSLMIDADFPGGKWTGAIIEVMQYQDWSDYSKLACDIYVPADAPKGLKAKMILTVGDQWKWVEGSKATALEPGKWVTLKADLKPGSIDWKIANLDDSFRKDVRKFDIRVESDNKPVYKGPIFVDNIRVIK